MVDVVNILHKILSKVTDTKFLLLVIGILVMVSMGLAIYGYSNTEGVNSSVSSSNSIGLLESLKNTDTARGLITFLVAVSTVAIAIILTLYIVVSKGEDFNEKKFSLGKEILTLLIGVLGTILGFYFGSTVDVKPKEISNKDINKRETGTIPSLQISQPYSSEQVKKGGELKLATFISGGKPPYKYTITFLPTGYIDPINEKISDTGIIQEALKIPDFVPPKTELTYQIEIKDSTGKRVVLDKDKTKILIEPE